jgi:hypothetical protein
MARFNRAFNTRFNAAFAGAAAGGIVGENVIAPRDPVYEHQFVAMLGAPAGLAAYLDSLYIANVLASPIYPIVGAFPLSTAAGTPVYGVDGPSTPLGDTYSKAVRLTDGQAAVISASGGPIVIGPRRWITGGVSKFAAATPGGNRIVWGHNSTDDLFVQLRTNGHLYCVIVDASVTTTVQLQIAHNDDIWTSWQAGYNGTHVHMISDRGVATPVALTPDIATTAAWQIGQSGNCPAMDFHMGYTFISDGTTAGDNAIAAAITNGQTYCQNLLSALVDP